nr:hypothetical protein CFP56_52964 [Quercus suber]
MAIKTRCPPWTLPQPISDHHVNVRMRTALQANLGTFLPTSDLLSQPLILSTNPSNRTLTIKNQNHASVQSSSATVLPARPLKSNLADLSSELATDYSFDLTSVATNLASPRHDLASPCRQSRQSSSLI